MRRREVGQPHLVYQNMGWENGYYYRVERCHGEAIREYLGNGIAAFMQAEFDEKARTARLAR